MTTSDIAVLVSMGSAAFGVINAVAGRSGILVTKIARLEQTVESLDGIPARLARCEAVIEFTTHRLDDVESEIKDILLEVKSISLEILKATVR
jgi:hypothetical protein